MPYKYIGKYRIKKIWFNSAINFFIPLAAVGFILAVVKKIQLNKS